MRSPAMPRSASSRSTAGCGPVPGALVAAEGARRAGLERLVCAAESGAEVALAGIEPVPVAPPRRGGRLPARRARPAASPRAAGRRRRTARRRARPRRRPRPGAGAPGARDRRRRRSQPPARRAARHRARRCSPAGSRASCRCSTTRRSLEVTRIHSVAGVLPPGAGLVRVPPFRAPHHSASAGGDRRRRRRAPRPGRGDARPPRRALSRRAARVPAAGRSRRCASRSRTAPSRSSASAGASSFPARFQLVGTMNLCPCGARGDRGAALLLHAAAARSATANGCRARCSTASTSSSTVPRPRGGRAGGAAGRGVDGGRGARRRRTRAPSRRPASALAAEPTSCSRAPSSGCRCRAAAARGSSRSPARSPRSPASERVEPEHLAEALSYRPPAELAE